jgi:hypothetical protein
LGGVASDHQERDLRNQSEQQKSDGDGADALDYGGSFVG